MENAELSMLIDQVASGSVEALEQIFLGMKDAIFSFALTYVKNRQTAEDLAQETMLALWQHAGNYKNSGSAKAWVLAIVRNAAIDSLRRTGREVPLADNRAEASTEDAPFAGSEMAEMLAQLSPDARRIILLHAIAGLKHREVAKLLNIPLGTACRKYAESVGQLRRIYNAR